MRVIGKMVMSVLIGLIVPMGALAQRTAKVSGTYTYVQPADESKVEAEARAVQKARIEALAAEFGTTVQQTNLTDVSDGNVKFHSLGLSEVKGEWLGDTKAPKFEYAMDAATGERVITVTVWGKGREIISSSIDVKAYLLRNGWDKKKNVDSDFNSGDQYFVAFNSPVDGYLAIYVMDEEGTATRLLPYRYSHKKSYRVKADTDYLFFERKKLNEEDLDESSAVESYLLMTDKPVEHNRMYIIFSPNEFVRPSDKDGGVNTAGLALPPVLSYNEMQDWLVKTRSRDRQMQVIHREINIRPDAEM